MTDQFHQEVSEGKRFEFGKNWQIFLTSLNDDKIKEAELSLKTMLDVESLAGKTFLDIGSGSGIHSLIARRLGAEVYSFDYDPYSVECTKYIKNKYFPEDSQWIVQEGSVLDVEYLKSLGKFDIVYSWGVLHHTGDMWKAISYATSLVSEKGQFFIAIYNRHWTSVIWKIIKVIYNKSPYLIKKLLVWLFTGIIFIGAFLTTRKNPIKGERGMEFKYDIVDWLGGYPYEYATIKEIITSVENTGFKIVKAIPTDGWTGCNQFIFKKGD
ncbi:3-demethylubiquinone-9 3-methyltransferase [Beggiatoa sp. PS]|nr:3-demethylubiquinone-9 3-methyltransferase [Beggiatoa sp. PS]